MQKTIFLENPASTKQIPNYPIECFYNEVTPDMGSSLLHWHFFCELICIHAGKIKVNVGEKTITLNAGDIIYIHPQQVHEAINYYDGITAMTLLKFDTSLLLSESNFEAEQSYLRPFLSQSGYKCLTFQNITHKIEPLLKNLVAEETSRTFGYEFRMRNLICSLISSLADTLSPFPVQQAIMSEQERLQFTQLSQYISDHFNEDNLTEVALKICHLSYSNFAIKFKRLFGKTFTEYINHVRIAYAQQLLINSNDSIAEIAEKCGYHDACYFSRIFSKLTGISPLVFRQNHCFS